jgi:hypothetical protein
VGAGPVVLLASAAVMVVVETGPGWVGNFDPKVQSTQAVEVHRACPETRGERESQLVAAGHIHGRIEDNSSETEEASGTGDVEESLEVEMGVGCERSAATAGPVEKHSVHTNEEGQKKEPISIARVY